MVILLYGGRYETSNIKYVIPARRGTISNYVITQLRFKIYSIYSFITYSCPSHCPFCHYWRIGFLAHWNVLFHGDDSSTKGVPLTLLEHIHWDGRYEGSDIITVIIYFGVLTFRFLWKLFYCFTNLFKLFIKQGYIIWRQGL